MNRSTNGASLTASEQQGPLREEGQIVQSEEARSQAQKALIGTECAICGRKENVQYRKSSALMTWFINGDRTDKTPENLAGVCVACSRSKAKRPEIWGELRRMRLRRERDRQVPMRLKDGTTLDFFALCMAKDPKNPLVERT